MKTFALTEERALVVLGNIAGRHVCAQHDLGPIASHLVGPIASQRPDWHPEPLPGKHHAAYVDRLIEPANGGRPIQCTCQWAPNPYVRVLQGGSQAAVAYPLDSSEATQAEVAALIHRADVDEMLHVLDPRLEALARLADLARAQGGGDLDPEAREAIQVLAATLCGRTRWDTIGGWGDGNIGGRIERRHGLASEKAAALLADAGVGMRIMQRLIEGR